MNSPSYFHRLAQNWRVPAFMLSTVGLHFLIELLDAAGIARAYLYFSGFFIFPLFVACFTRRHKAAWAAIFTVSLLTLRYLEWISMASPDNVFKESLVFITALLFGVIVSVCTIVFAEKITARFFQKA